MDSMNAMPAMNSSMNMMEHPEPTMSAPPLVDQRVLLRFCQAVLKYADSAGSHDDAARKLRSLRARLNNLRGLASLCRLAIAGHPHSLARVVDEMNCLAADFPADPLEDWDGEAEMNEDEPETRVQLAAAIDLFAGATFASKDNPEQRDRFIIGVVRAIEDAIGFPVTLSSEAAAYLGQGDKDIAPTHARIVIANAAERLIESDQACAPQAPREIRMRLECLARRWMCKNPVDEFFAAISGPKVRHIVHWEDPQRTRPDDARVGDPVTLLTCEPGDGCCGPRMDDLAVMFCPHQPAPVIRVMNEGLQVRVPPQSRTGPIAIVRKMPDFTGVKSLIAEFAACFPDEWSFSIFASVRMDTWAYPDAFGPPILEIMPEQKSTGRVPTRPPTGHSGAVTPAPGTTVFTGGRHK